MNRGRRWAFLSAVATLLLVAWGCGGGRGGAAGEEQPAGEGERIVVLSPAAAVMLRDLGLADRIVGRHDYDMVLPDSIPAVGHQEAIDYEALIRVDPTLIIIEWGSRPLPPRLTELAAAHGWAVKRITLLTLDDIARTLDDLAIVLGAVDLAAGEQARPPGMGAPADLRVLPRFTDPAERLEQPLPSARLARAWSRRGDGFGDLGGILLLAATDPPGALGPGSFHQQILERIGGTPAIETGTPWIELDVEDIARLAPSGIVLVAPRGRGVRAEPIDRAEIERRLGRIATLDIPAVRSGRLGLIDDPLSLLPSTSMARFADELAAILEGWRGP